MITFNSNISSNVTSFFQILCKYSCPLASQSSFYTYYRIVNIVYFSIFFKSLWILVKKLFFLSLCPWYSKECYHRTISLTCVINVLAFFLHLLIVWNITKYLMGQDMGLNRFEFWLCRAWCSENKIWWFIRPLIRTFWWVRDYSVILSLALGLPSVSSQGSW